MLVLQTQGTARTDVTRILHTRYCTVAEEACASWRTRGADGPKQRATHEGLHRRASGSGGV
jgi:hypothetical protein